MYKSKKGGPTSTANLAGEAGHQDRYIGFSVCAALLIGTFALYFPALGGEILIWDDEINIWHTPQIRTLDLSSLAWMFTDTEHALRYKPLCWLLWSCMIHLFGGSSPFRFPNLLLHAINSVLLFQLLLGFSRRPGNCYSLRDFAIAGGLAAGWAWLPARIEPTTWISGLGYPLALSFSLLSALMFRESISPSIPGIRHRTFVISLLFWASALLSYPSALCALPLFPVLALTSGGTWSVRRTIKQSSGHIVLGGILAMGMLATRVWNYGTWSESALTSISPSEQLARTIYFPLWTMSRTNPLATVGPIYDNMTRPTLYDPLVWGGGLMLVLVSILLFRLRNIVPLVLWVSYLIALTPHIGLTEHLFVPTDRYSYTPSIFLFLLLNSLVLALPNRTRNATVPILAMLVIIMVPVTWSQSSIWKTNEALFDRAFHQVQTDRFRSEVLLRTGRLEQAKADISRAEELFQQSVLTGAGDPLAHTYLAAIYTEQSRLKEAAEQYRFLLNLDPDDPNAANNFGLVLIRMNRPIEAVAILERAASQDPSPSIVTNLAYAYVESGDPTKAQHLLTPEICAAWQPAERLRVSLQAIPYPRP